MSEEERNRQWVFVHVEKVEPDKGVVLFDFVDSNEFSLFASFVDSDANFERGSMVRMRNYEGPAITEGVTYYLAKTVVDSWVREGRLTNVEEESLVLRFELNAEGMNDRPFVRSKTFSFEERWMRRIDFTGGADLSIVDGNMGGQLQLLVRDVGQGNWNELHEGGRIRLVYDAGTAWTASAGHVRALAGARDAQYQTDTPGFVLSHWDVDHYHLLLAMADTTIGSFSYFICRGSVPNLSSRRVLGRLLMLAWGRTIGLAPLPRIRGIAPMVHPIHHSGGLVLYNAEYHRDRNRSGVLLTVSGPASTAILPADHHYYQISGGIMPFLNPSNTNHLVVPHHGGSAGPITFVAGALNFGQAAVSVGVNGYGHPDLNVTAGLAQLGFNVQSTQQMNADIVIPLP